METVDIQETGRIPNTTTSRIITCEEIESWIRAKVADALEVEASNVDLHKNFSEFGLDSIIAFSLTGEMVEWIGIELSPTLLWEHPTISSVSRHISEQLGQHGNVQVSDAGAVLLKNNEARNNLFCICGIGLYQTLANQFPDSTNVYGVYVAPEKSLGKFGKDVSEAYEYLTLEDLAEVYYKAIVSIQREGPYYLLGSSFGGVIAFDVAQQLIRRGTEVPLVVLVDSFLPSAVRPRMYKRVIQFLHSNIELLRSEINTWNKKDSQEQLSYYDMRSLRSKYYWSLGERYVPADYDGSILLFRATGEELLGPGYVAEVETMWSSVADGSLEIIGVEGTHMGLLSNPHVVEVAAAIHNRIKGQA